MKNKFALALVSIVLIAGCTSTTTTATTGGAVGLAITDFSLNPAEARSSQTVVAKMSIENQGQVDAAAGDYLALLIGPISSSQTPGPGEWKIVGSTKNPQRTDTVMRKALGEQKPVPRTFTWSLQTPQSGGADTPVDFTGRIYYNYSTEATGLINVYPDSEIDRAVDKSSFTTTRGPIQLTVEVNPDPPVIYSDKDQFTLTIHVKNVGNGIVFNKTQELKYETVDNVKRLNYTIDPQEELGKIKLSLVLPTNLEQADKDSVGSTSCLDNIQFFGTSKEELTTCAINVLGKPLAKTPYRISVKADYGYYDEAKARVILKAR